MTVKQLIVLKTFRYSSSIIRFYPSIPHVAHFNLTRQSLFSEKQNRPIKIVSRQFWLLFKDILEIHKALPPEARGDRYIGPVSLSSKPCLKVVSKT
jgi:hypothetical protein